ncbi:MAG: FAD-binding protein [Clostridiales bacterium]|nr:FAD-binding protein [Clostridiales bacterium]
MIPFNFVYCRPATLEQAYEAFGQLQAEGKNPVYYAGGSEVITLCRAGSIAPGAVIDLKEIPECRVLSADREDLHFGAARTLNDIKESRLVPLLTLCCGRIADHTNQCRITLGGNLCGTILYRETCLPLLLADATVTLFGGRGLHAVPFQSVFDGRMQLEAGEFIVEVGLPGWAAQAPHWHIKRTTNEKIDYPLVSLAALCKDGRLRVALSGVCSYPFRSAEIEDVLNDSSLSIERRVEGAAALLPEPAYSDVRGSGQYRVFVLKNTLQTLLEAFSNDQI